MNDHYFNACNWVVLVVKDFLCSCSIYVRLARSVCKCFFKTPRLYLSIHFSIFFLYIPYSRFQWWVLLFKFINTLFKLIIFSPDNILCGHSFGEMINISKRMKYVMIFIDFLFKIFMFFHFFGSLFDFFTEMLFCLFQALKWGFFKCTTCWLQHILMEYIFRYYNK